MKRFKAKIVIPILLVLCLLAWLFWPKKSAVSALTAQVSLKPFASTVVSSGELMAENSRNILGPEGLQRYRIYDLKVENIIPEGTHVKKGEYIASLDRSDLTTKINDTELDLEKAESQYTQIKLDTALTLREARDNIKNLVFQEEQAKLTLEQSKYEPPATIKQAELNVEKATRTIKQARENYILKQRQAVAKLREASSNLQKSRNRLQKLLDLQEQFTIMAPDDGMLIYQRDWGGQKVKTGSQVSTWDPIVGTLPDLSSLLSKTYINEVDISRVHVDQPVDISLDAFPAAVLKGKVIEVANMGEQRKNSDSKVFEVVIKVTEADSTYRPGMTTSNSIITNQIDEALLIPIEAVFGNDSISWAYVKDGVSTVRKQVEVGPANDVEIVVENGLEAGETVFLAEPEKGSSFELIPLKK